MPHPSEVPCASLAVLKKNGMDVSKFGSCSRQEKDGREILNMGCTHHKKCPWANEAVPERTIAGVKVEGGLRPRNKKYLLVKPTASGRRKVKEGWCSCFEWHQNFSKLHGKNGVVCRITGEEGSSYQVRGSVKVAASEPGGEPHWEPKFWKEIVPAFKSDQSTDLQAEGYAEAVLKESGLLDEDEAIRAALSGGSEGARDVTLEMDIDEVAAAVQKRGRPSS